MAAFADRFPFARCHLETAPAIKVTADLRYKVYASELFAKEWYAYMPDPPTIPGQQQLLSATMSVDGTDISGRSLNELSPEHRLVMSAVVPVVNDQLTKELAIRSNYSIELVPRRLVDGPATTAVIPLTREEQWLYTASSITIDHASDAFRYWLRSKGLIRTTGERDIDFAWRAFQAIRSQYHYHFINRQNRKASNICGLDGTDCGGLSFLFVAVMRANQIPARALVGRWLKSNYETDQSKAGPDVGENHVKSEFYANGVGWVPVELSGAVSNKAGEPANFFGEIKGNFVTFHIDPDMIVDAGQFGHCPVEFMQNPVWWVSGRGPVEPHTQTTVWHAIKDR